MRTDNNMYDHVPAHDPHELVQRMERLEIPQTEHQNRQEAGTAHIQSVSDNVTNLEQRFTRVQDGTQKFEASYNAKGKQKEVAECSRRRNDDDSSPDDHHPRGGIPRSPAPMLKGVTLPRTPTRLCTFLSEALGSRDTHQSYLTYLLGTQQCPTLSVCVRGRRSQTTFQVSC